MNDFSHTDHFLYDETCAGCACDLPPQETLWNPVLKNSSYLPHVHFFLPATPTLTLAISLNPNATLTVGFW